MISFGNLLITNCIDFNENLCTKLLYIMYLLDFDKYSLAISVTNITKKKFDKFSVENSHHTFPIENYLISIY